MLSKRADGSMMNNHADNSYHENVCVSNSSRLHFRNLQFKAEEGARGSDGYRTIKVIINE